MVISRHTVIFQQVLQPRIAGNDGLTRLGVLA